MEDLLPYNQYLDIYNKGYPGLNHTTRIIPDKQEYWEVPVRVVKEEVAKPVYIEVPKEEDKQEKELIREKITEIDTIKTNYKYFKYIILILLLMFIYLIILFLMNMNYK